MGIGPYPDLTMRWITRSMAMFTVLGALVLICLPADPLPAPGQERAVPAAVRTAGLVRLPEGWSNRVLSHLADSRLPMGRDDLQSLLRIAERTGHRFQVDPLTILAIIQVESRFEPNAVSTQGGLGLMQLQLDTAKEVAEALGISLTSQDQLLDPELNVVLGTYYFRSLLNRFGDLDSALAAFNVGPTRIQWRKAFALPVPLAYADRVWEAITSLRSRAVV